MHFNQSSLHVLSSVCLLVQEMQNDSHGYAKYIRKGTVQTHVMELPLSGEQHWQPRPLGPVRSGMMTCTEQRR